MKILTTNVCEERYQPEKMLSGWNDVS